MRLLKKNYFLLLLLFSTLISLSTIIWSMNKGFDLSDEGYYIAGYNNLIESTFGLSAFYFLTINTLSKIGSGLIFFRMARLILTIMGSLFLSLAFFKWLMNFNYIKREQEKKVFISLSLFCLIGSFVGYCYGPQTLSYNHYTLIFGNLFFGLIFLSFTHKNSIKKSMLISSSLGIFCTLEFLVKIPCAILFILIFLGSQAILFMNLRGFVFINLFLFSCFAFLTLAVIGYPASPLNILNEYYSFVSFFSKFISHNIFDVLRHYKVGIITFWDEHLIKYFPSYFGLLITLVIYHQNKFMLIKPIGKYFFLFISLFIIFTLYHDGYFLSGSKYIGTSSLIYIFLLFVFLTVVIFLYANSTLNLLSDFLSEKIFVIALLLFFPIICSIGSNNYLQVQILLFLNSWFLFIYLIYAFIRFEKSQLGISISILMFTIIVKSTIDVFSGLVIDPYRVNGHLWEQTEVLKIQSSNETIFIDKELKKTVIILQDLITRNNPDALFMSNDLIGLGYILNKKLIGIGGYDCVVSPKEFICQSYNHSVLKEKNKVFFILSSELNKCNIFDCIAGNKTRSKLVTLPYNKQVGDSIFIYEGCN